MKNYKGILFIILAGFSFSMMNMFVRLSGDLPFYQKAFFRNFIAFLVSSVMMTIDFTKGKKYSIKKPMIKYLFMRAFFGTIALVCNFYAVDNLVISDASMLNKMSPFFAIIGCYFIMKEKLSLFQGIIVVTAFIGSLFIIKPSFMNMSLFPALIGFLSGIGAGLAYAMVRKLGSMGLKGTAVVFSFSAFSTITLLPVVIATYQPMSLYQLSMLLLAGLSATMGQFSITAAYYHAPAKELSVYEYSQVVFSALLGFIAFSQIPDIYSVFGYIIIISAGVVMFMKTNNLFFFKNKTESEQLK